MIVERDTLIPGMFFPVISTITHTHQQSKLCIYSNCNRLDLDTSIKVLVHTGKPTLN